MTTYATIFTAASSVTILPAVFLQAFTIPAYDAGNVDVSVTNNGVSQITLAWGAGNLAGGLNVQPGQTVLLTNNPATLAACLTNPNVIGTGAANPPGNATSITALAIAAGGTVTITRGTAISKLAF